LYLPAGLRYTTEKAAAAGVPVYDVKDPNATRAWKAYQAAGKELLTYAGGK